MTVEMKKYKLGDVCLKITDGSHFSPKGVDFGYPMYSVKDMNEFGFNNSDYKMISEKDFKSLVAAGCRPQKDDVLIAKDGSYLKYAFVCKEEKDEVILSSIAILRPNKNIIDPTFFSFLLRNPSVKKSMKYYVSGTALPRIVLDNFKKMEINIPELLEQKKIGKILSTLDKRIENLRAQNRVLEQTAKTIYDYTFLQCVGHQTTYNKTLNRNIPTNWEVKTIGEILDKVSATTKIETKLYQQSGKYPVIDQSTNFIAGYTDDESAVIRKTPAVFFGDHTRIVKMINFEFARGSDGTQILYSKEQNVGPFYLYFAVKAIDLSNMGYARHFKFLKDKPIAIPDKNTSDSFEKAIRPLFDKILINRKQIEALTTQRNTLLPLLMTGQVEV